MFANNFIKISQIGIYDDVINPLRSFLKIFSVPTFNINTFGAVKLFVHKLSVKTSFDLTQFYQESDLCNDSIGRYSVLQGVPSSFLHVLSPQHQWMRCCLIVWVQAPVSTIVQMLSLAARTRLIVLRAAARLVPRGCPRSLLGCSVRQRSARRCRPGHVATQGNS